LTKKSESQLSSLKVLAECNSLNQLPTAAAAAAAAAAAVCLIMSHCFGYLYCAVCDIRGCSADRNMMAQAAMMQESMQWKCTLRLLRVPNCTASILQTPDQHNVSLGTSSRRKYNRGMQ